METNPAKLTDWILTGDHPPKHVGEYIASVTKCSILLRWWNGKFWSEPYTDKFTERSKQHLRRKKALVQPHTVFYRGLRAKPRVYTIHYLKPLK